MSLRTRKRRMLVIMGAAVTLVAFLGYVAFIYRMRPTVATAALAMGWMSMCVVAYLMFRTAQFVDASQTIDFDEMSGAELLWNDLNMEKKSLLKAIREVEFDVQIGKVDADEAKETVAGYRARAIEIIKISQARDDKSLHETVEAELKKRMAGAATGVCESCQTKNDADATFCKKCGGKMGGGQ